ncbi:MULTISPECIES: DUF5615 family PIN-like protein [unclassified Microcoleus]|uniref:DUF5615 family PIN-like protein n=1 Tax=unclassified Microcoleus TaxID=2642155 RepID=UPI0040407CB0
MLNLYADEQFPLPVVQLLRAFGHNVLTVQEAGKAGLGGSALKERIRVRYD